MHNFGSNSNLDSSSFAISLAAFIHGGETSIPIALHPNVKVEKKVNDV